MTNKEALIHALLVFSLVTVITAPFVEPVMVIAALGAAGFRFALAKAIGA